MRATLLLWLGHIVAAWGVSRAEGPAPADQAPGWMAPAIRIAEADRQRYAAFLASHKVPEPARGQFPKTMAECALPEDRLPKVIEGHPRLLLRVRPWDGGLSLDEFRRRAREEPWASGLKSCADPRHGARCALYYLATGDESVVPGLVERILSYRNAGYGLGGQPALIYDWIYDSARITPEKRKEVEDHLVRLAHSAVALQEGGNCGDVWRHRGGGAMDPLMIGLALCGEHPEGQALLRMGMGYYRRAFLPAWQHSGGGWLGGGHSYDGAAWGLPLALASWASATEEPIFEVIRRDFGNWLEDRMYFWMHQVFPDKTRSESIGTDYTPWKLIINTDEFLIASRAYGNPDGYAFLRWLGPAYEPRSGQGFHVLLYDERLEGRPPSKVFSRPFSKLWGRNGLGYAQMRSEGWQPDSAVVEFKSGDYFELHGHYANQNSFYIYHQGRLALQGGTYAAGSGVWSGGDHAVHYYRRTVSTNSLLVFQPGEFHTMYGHEGFLPIAGQMADVFGYRNFTQDEYLWRLKNDPRYEMGNITACEHAPDFSYTYLCGDATPAYNSPRYATWALTGAGDIVANRPKLDLFTRSLVYLPPSNLVVFDRVNALDASYRKAWLLQSIGRPEVSGQMVAAEVPGHIEDFDGDTVTVTWSGGICRPPNPDDPGRLLVRTFLPEQRLIRRIGGKGHEFYANGRNHPPTGDARMRYLPGRGQEVLAWVWDEKRGEGQDMANWRIEVSPARPAAFDNFLHLIHICDARTDRPPEATRVTAQGEKMVGVAVGGWVVMFGRGGEVEGEVAYSAPEGRMEHLVVDLRRGAPYAVSVGSGASRMLSASDEGVLRFASTGPGRIRLAPAVPNRTP